MGDPIGGPTRVKPDRSKDSVTDRLARIEAVLGIDSADYNVPDPKKPETTEPETDPLTPDA